MRIGIVCHPSIGGSGVIATELGLGLARKGHQVHFVSSSTPVRLPGMLDNVYFHSVEPINYPLFDDKLYTFALTAKICEVAQQHQLDIVHAHYSIPHSLCAHLARQVSGRDFKVVTTIHGTDATVVGQDRPLYPLNRFSIDQSDMVTTVSEYQKKYLLDFFDLDRDIRVIYNFVDPEVFTPERAKIEQRQLLAQDDEKLIMHISNFRQLKNTLGVVKAFASIADQVGARLVLVGDGPEVTATRNLCKALGVLDRVTFAGMVTQIEEIIANADCVIQPSHRESFGMVALEAMSSGVPPVCSDRDGVPEVTIHGETGFIADPDDHAALGGYLARICSEPALHKQLAENGRRRAMKLFNLQDKVDEYLDNYHSCLAI